MEGTLAGSMVMKVLNAFCCVVCREAIQDRSAYAVGAPYHCMVHIRCMPYFTFDGRYPHEMPMVFYDPPPLPPVFVPRPQLRTSQDDNGFHALRR